MPVPELASLRELNELLAAACVADLGRTIRGAGRRSTRRSRARSNRLRALPAERFDASEHASPRVDQKALVTVRQNRYSVPVSLAGLRVAARIGAREIGISHDGREVARHLRLDERFGVSAQLDHYLELLARKPGALVRSLALGQDRERGHWPECFDELWRGIEARVGPPRPPAR